MRPTSPGAMNGGLDGPQRQHADTAPDILMEPVSDTEADEMEEHLRGWGYLE